MAVSSTPVLTGPNIQSWDVIATADTDTNIIITHTFGGTGPLLVFFTKIGTPVQNVADWSLVSTSSSNINVTKNNVVGSGQVGAQVRVTAMRPHSMVL